MNEFLHAGKTPYKLYHGYNFTGITELFNSHNYTLQTFYQNNGRFIVWFINKLDTSKRIKVIEYNKSSSMFLVGILANPENTDIFWPSLIKSKDINLGNYFNKKDKLRLLDLDLVNSKIIELENFFREENA
jgi:hypothetical protein